MIPGAIISFPKRRPVILSVIRKKRNYLQHRVGGWLLERRTVSQGPACFHFQAGSFIDSQTVGGLAVPLKPQTGPAPLLAQVLLNAVCLWSHQQQQAVQSGGGRGTILTMQEFPKAQTSPATPLPQMEMVSDLHHN